MDSEYIEKFLSPVFTTVSAFLIVVIMGFSSHKLLNRTAVGVARGPKAIASPTADLNALILSFFILHNDLQNSNHLHLFHKIWQLNIYILPVNYINQP